MTDLKLTPTKDLIDELGSRFEHYIFGGIQTNVGKKDNMISTRRYAGCFTMCKGLCSEITHCLNLDDDKNFDKIED